MRSGDCQGVFTALVEDLGVKNVQFEEILDLSPDYLRAIAFVPLYHEVLSIGAEGSG